MNTLLLRFASFCLCLHHAQSANILGVFPMASISHQVVYQTVWKELSLRGHQVTVLTTDPLNDPRLVNVTELDLHFAYSILKELNIQKTLHKDLPMSEIITNYYELYGKVSEAELRHPSVQTLIRDTNNKFDVMIVEFLHPLMYALSVKFGCPMIGISSYNILLPEYDAVGNPSHPVLHPDMLLQVDGNLGFFDRIYSLYFSIWIRYYYHYHVIPKYDKIAREYIGNDLPYLGDIEKNVSLLFLNVNPIVHSIRPNVPAVIEVGTGGTRKLGEKKPLPIDLQAELDSGKNGVVYFSLGSNVKSINLSLKVRQIIIKALSELPYKIFWKWEDDHLPGQPKNVIIRKWFPQEEILGHPNVKVFVTQCGLQSMEEAIVHKVPLVAMPFIADQPFNALKIVKLGIGQSVDIEKVDKDVLKKALIEVAENPKYRNKIKEISSLLTDEPMTGLEKIIWWTEYVIRHKGAHHLKSPAVDMPWYQYHLLDICAFILLVTLVIAYAIYVIILLGIKIGKKAKLKLA